MLNNAFRTAPQFDQQSGHSAASWSRLFADLPVARELLNSTLICLVAILIILFVSTTARLRLRQAALPAAASSSSWASSRP